MPNVFENPNLIAKEGLRLLENNLVAAKKINRQYDPQFNKSGTKPGVTINIRNATRYIIRTGQLAQPQGIQDRLVPLTINRQAGVDLGYSSQDEALSLESYSDQVLKPSIATIANQIDADVLAEYVNVPNLVGTPGTTPNTLLTYLQAGGILTDMAAPKDNMRHAILDSTMELTLVDALKGLFHAGSEVAEQYRSGEMGRTAGLNFFMDQNVKSHTIGAYTGTPSNGLVNGANQSGSSLITDTWTGSVVGLLKRGDIFTIGSGATGVYRVNPMSRETLKSLKQFVVLADVDSSGGAATIPFAPAIVPTGPYQNVSQLPPDNATINVSGAASTVSPQGLVFHRDFCTLAMVDLYVPKGVDLSGRASSPKLGLSIRFIRYYDGNTDQLVTRLDVLYGIKSLRPDELAVRVAA